MSTTENYYNKNSEAFIRETLEIDMSAVYAKFIPLLPAGGTILDAGCGSGRDSLFFKNKGFTVTAIDNCPEFVSFTDEYAGVEAYQLSFKEINWKNKFDGIWACASLLHLNKTDLAEVLKIFSRALKQNGILYTSFKYGDFSGERNNRMFTDLNATTLAEIISTVNDLKIIETWVTEDQRKHRKADKWLNNFSLKT